MASLPVPSDRTPAAPAVKKPEVAVDDRKKRIAEAMESSMDRNAELLERLAK